MWLLYSSTSSCRSEYSKLVNCPLMSRNVFCSQSVSLEWNWCYYRWTQCIHRPHTAAARSRHEPCTHMCKHSLPVCKAVNNNQHRQLSLMFWTLMAVLPAHTLNYSTDTESCLLNRGCCVYFPSHLLPTHFSWGSFVLSICPAGGSICLLFLVGGEGLITCNSYS